MRKLHVFVITITASIMLLTCCICVNAETVKVSEGVTGGYIYFDTETGTITDCDTRVSSVEIPDKINDITVAIIGEDAFAGCTSLVSITISNNVTAIEDYAFYECTSLEHVTIPNSVTTIGSDVFFGCVGLGNITIPNSVITIGGGVFAGCTNLKNIAISNSVTSIDEKAFYGCTSLDRIIIPNSVTSIGESAFDGCKGLEHIMIPNSVTIIGWGAFYGCISLRSVRFYNELTTIVEKSFYRCSDELIFYGYEGSTAEFYANTYGYRFGLINGTASLSGLVTGYKGNEAARVSVAEVGNESNTREVVADKGTYLITALELGTYSVTVSCNECALRSYTIDVLSDTTQDVCIYQIGDVDMNGEIDAADVTQMARHLAKLDPIKDEYCHKLMDADRNGEVGAADVTHLARYIARLVNKL